MSVKNTRVLAVAARTGRIGCVYLLNGVLKDWAMSRKAAASTDQAAKILKRWILQYAPDTIISENPDAATRKAPLQKSILKTLSVVAEDAQALNILVARQKMHKNIYLEAQFLAERYKGNCMAVPKKPPIWMPEPRSTVYFEALAMADQVLI